MVKKGRLYLEVAGEPVRGRSRLVWVEEHPSQRQAVLRKNKIKGWRRGCKVALIEKRNPGWKDLSRPDVN